jgi:hypothetical protein
MLQANGVLFNGYPRGHPPLYWAAWARLVRRMGGYGQKEVGGRSRDGLAPAWRVKKKVGRRRKDEPSQFGERADLLWKDCSLWLRILLRRNVRKIFVREDAAITLTANQSLRSGEADDRKPAVAVAAGDKVAQAA